MSAIETSFSNFQAHFNVNALQFLSLPSIALRSLFALYDNQNAPAVYSFGDVELCRLFRREVVGGLGKSRDFKNCVHFSVNIFARHIHLDGDEKYPREARFAPNGDPFTHHVFFDFK